MEIEKKAQESTSDNAGEGLQSEATSLIEKATRENERLEKNLNELKKESLRLEGLRAKEILGGRSNGIAPPQPPKKLSDLEYAQAVRRGEANPLKEDGFISE